MESYTDFAYLYDEFMDEVPYEEWASLMDGLIRAYGENVKSVVDLGCGTGTLTELLYDLGYEMTGIDLSTDMLSVASDKALSSDKDILYVNQDMREFSLLSETDCVISLCDCINYLITDEDVKVTFSKIYENLRKNGLFIFDFNTVFKYENVIGDTTIAENRDDCAFIWDNFYDPDTHINEYDIAFFKLVEEDRQHFERFEETHIQRGYELSEMKSFLKEAGFKFIMAFDEKDSKTTHEDSERIYVVARR